MSRTGQMKTKLMDVVDSLDALELTPTAFNWTPAMSAVFPVRLTMSQLTAMWEALHDAAEYTELGSQASDDGWIEWNGGVMPVWAGTQIKVRHRDLREHIDSAGGWHSNNWFHDGLSGDIIAYSVIK